MFVSRVLRQAAQHAERTPLIHFLGKRSIPASIDHSRHPHPASPSHDLPSDFGPITGSSHASFSSYRDHAQQFGPLRKTIVAAGGIGGTSGHKLGPVAPAEGEYFDRDDLPARFRRVPLSPAEIEAVETGGATLFG